VIRVFVVDDHEIVRRGLIGLLQAESDIEVVGEAATARQASGRIAATGPDVAVLDVRLPDGSGIDVCRELTDRAPNVRSIMMTAYDDDDALLAAVIAGAYGYVRKDMQANVLVDAIRTVASGRRLLDPKLADRMADRMRGESGSGPDSDPRLASLGLRERQVLALIADGLTNRQIGEHLNLAEKTVKNYVSGLLRKLGLERRTQAAVFELEHRQH
jgi:two-component system, NarL family, response regulator DevR